jgi:hypothetical protein
MEARSAAIGNRRLLSLTPTVHSNHSGQNLSHFRIAWQLAICVGPLICRSDDDEKGLRTMQNLDGQRFCDFDKSD